MRTLTLSTTTALMLGFSSLVALAQTAPMTEDQKKAVWDAANKASIAGPQDVALLNQAQLHLSADMLYIPTKEASDIMKMWGNSTSTSFQGLVFPKDLNQPWVVSINHIADGYVKDEDAKTWNADELLQSLKDGTESQNVEREKMGIPGLEIVGWVQPPQYDASKHQLVWSLKAKDKGAAATAANTINYNTYALGRDGYFEINMMTSSDTIEKDKVSAHKIVGDVDYNTGKDYADFNPATDNVAEYGLAALVAGVAAKKLGLFALIAAFAAKFAKVIAIGAFVIGGTILKTGLGAVRSLFGRKNNPEA